MKFSDLLTQAKAWLQREGRLRYRSLQREFDLDDQALADLRDELIEGQRVAVDEEGKILVWVGDGEAPAGPPSPSPPQLQMPASYTPAHLAQRIRTEQAAMEARGATDGERKTITALFADIKGSMELIEDLDPEEARSLIDPALTLMMEAVHRYEGYVVQSTGDGIFALFGAPLAHEDHPQRALFAALRMQEDLKRYADQLRLQGQRPLEVRVGVNTGEVVVRSIHTEDLRTEYTPIGHSTSLAARLQSLATGGGIVISEQTYRLTEGYFECKALGAARVKGVTEPVPIYEVLGVGPLRTRLQVSARRGFTRFVGRQSELEQLRRALAQATAGHGQIVGVMGEPGLGKSRLFYEFKLTSHSGCLVLEAYSVSYGKASPYLPVLELLKSYFQLHPHDDERTRREKVGGKVLMLNRRLEETLPYLFAVLGIDDPTASLQQMDPQIRRRRTFAALKQLFLRESLNQPLTLIFEDLHWIDTETQGFLDTLSESVASARILLLVNYRPEYRPAWGQKTYSTQLRLAPLGTEEAEELLTVLLGTDGSLTALKHLILEKTEGTPFFMEEVVQTLAEEGVLSGERGHYRMVQAPTEIHLSPTVQGVLAARIDRLSREEKDLVQHLAVIGREFPLSLVRQVLPQPEEELYRLLSALQNKEFLYEQPAFPEVEYHFKHALTQEVAYGTVLQERRKALHERTAQAMEALYHATLDEHYSELAHHYSRSGNTEKAIEYLHLAGQQAVQRSAYAEAIQHLTTALELLTTLPDTPERSQYDLTLHLSLGPALVATKGYASPEVEKTYTRARELCRQATDTFQLFRALWGLRRAYLVQGRLQTTRELSQELLTIAQKTHDRTLLLEGYEALGSALFFLGEPVLAREYLEQGVTLYLPSQPQVRSFLNPQDPGVMSLAYASLALWVCGYPDQALKRSQEALRRAQELAHPHSLAGALALASMLHIYRKEVDLSQQRAEAAMTLAVEHGLLQWEAGSTVNGGWVLAEQGKGEAGIAQVRQGIAAWQALGARLVRSHYCSLLGEACAKAGRLDAGLQALADALTAVQETDEHFQEAEIYRLKGELTLQQSRVQSLRSSVPSSQHLAFSAQEEAEAYFQKAIEIACQQQAKSWELRAVMSLSRLWQQQGKKDEARQLLAEIYNWFTEGFDTKDLQEAKVLLEELEGDH